MPEFVALIQTFDIFVCVESKIDELDIIPLPTGYLHFSKYRKGFEKKSGGISILYKQSIGHNIEFIESECEYVQWLKFKQDKSNILIGCVYVPPEGSRYASKDALEEIEREFLSFIGNNDKYALIGDFNARTGNLSDYVELDNDIVEIINNGYDEELPEIIFDYKNLISLNIPLKRCSQDKGRPNSFGYKLVDFCTRCNMYIANGRIGQDRDVGKTV